MKYEKSLVGSRRRQRLLVGAAPAALAAVLLAALWFWKAELTPPEAPPLAALMLLTLLTALAAVHAPLGGAGLGLGAVSVPLGAHFFGPLATALALAAAFLGARAAARLMTVRRSREDVVRWLLELAAALGRVVLASLAALLIWRLLVPADALPGRRALAGQLAAAAVYLILLPALELAESRWSGEPTRWRRLLAPLTVDLMGWGLGLAIFGIAAQLGWGAGVALVGVVALLSLEAARNGRLRRLAEQRVRELQAVHLAGHRIIFRHPDMLGIAEQIHVECRRVVPFQWFHFELAGDGDGVRSWFAGPDRKVLEGRPEPPAEPPKLPGIHRRSGWRLLERELAAADERLGRLRLWCDPRRLDETSLELLDTLVPQMASSVQRALLDRDARRDPLTDLPDRRAFENRLAQVFEECKERGESMAVLLCDVDSFKRINDRNGHAVGDDALLQVARELEGRRREDDLCSRYGGDEFALVLERADGRQALAIAERLREGVASRKTGLDVRIPLRLSIGVAAFPELPVAAPADLVQLADEALYEAKRRGRNRCLLHLGHRRFLTVNDQVLEEGESTRPEPPTLFS